MRCQQSKVAHRILLEKMVHGPKKDREPFMTLLSSAKHAPLQINQKKQLELDNQTMSNTILTQIPAPPTSDFHININSVSM